jgi:hypothetical protein
MEILAIVVLGLSAFAGFSTAARKPKCKVDPRCEQDPDWAFTQADNADGSIGKE